MARSRDRTEKDYGIPSGEDEKRRIKAELDAAIYGKNESVGDVASPPQLSSGVPPTPSELSRPIPLPELQPQSSATSQRVGLMQWLPLCMSILALCLGAYCVVKLATSNGGLDSQLTTLKREVDSLKQRVNALGEENQNLRNRLEEHERRSGHVDRRARSPADASRNNIAPSEPADEIGREQSQLLPENQNSQKLPERKPVKR